MAQELRAKLYDDLPEGSIRLLSLDGTCLAGGDGENCQDLAIRCTLRTVSLAGVKKQKDLSFAALSYVWGHNRDLRPIVCNGVEMLVKPNLHDALRKFVRYKQRPPWLWVDAVCIDQKNNAEKGAQVRLMGDIYRTASSVLVWLGTSAEVAEGAFERYWRYLEDKKSQGISYDQDAAERVAAFVANSDWFRRVWTLQEIGLAKRAQVHCGPYEASWDKFATWTSSKDKVHEFDDIRAVRGARGRGLPLGDLLRAASRRKSFMVHDRFYGLLGLYKGNWADPDYALTDTHVLAQATMVAAAEQGNLNFFNQVKLRRVSLLPAVKRDADQGHAEGQSSSATKLPAIARSLFTKSSSKVQHEDILKSTPARSIIRNFQYRQRPVSWVPSWQATTQKEAERMTKDLDVSGLAEGNPLNNLYKKSDMRIEAHGTVLLTRGLVVGRFKPMQCMLRKEHFFEGRVEFEAIPECVRKALQKAGGAATENNDATACLDAATLYTHLLQHDTKKCSCEPDREIQEGLGWQCVIYGVPDLIVLEPRFESSTGKVRFALLLRSFRDTSSRIAHELKRSLGGQASSDVGTVWDRRLQGTFTAIPSAFEILGDIDRSEPSPFWRLCPDEAPGIEERRAGNVEWTRNILSKQDD